MRERGGGEDMPEIRALAACLPLWAAELLQQTDRQALEEIRFYVGAPVELVIGGQRVVSAVRMNETRMDELLAALSGSALYRYEAQMAMGYMPLAGGHRAGVCGRLTRREDGALHMSAVTSVCLRIARQVDGASKAVRGSLMTEQGRIRRVLLLGPPGCGKTTVLRDAALYLSGFAHVAVADEREELFPAGMSLQEGRRLDVLRGAEKDRAFSMLLRAMSPQAIVCDELGRTEDVQAVLDAARCGAGLLASAHADGLEDLLSRPALRSLFDADAFERYIHLGRRGAVRAVYDRSGRRLDQEKGENCGQMGDGGDGDDRRKQHRLSLV